MFVSNKIQYNTIQYNTIQYNVATWLTARQTGVSDISIYVTEDLQASVLIFLYLYNLTQWRQFGLKSGGSWIPVKKFRFFQNFFKNLVFQATSHKKIDFPGKFPKNLTFQSTF